MLRVAVIDDQVDIARLIELQFEYAEDEDIEVVVHLSTYPEVLAYDGWADIDAATIDWMLPGRDGIHVHAWLAEHHPHVVTAIVTAAPDSLKRDHADFDGVVVAKPYDLSHLIRLLRGGPDAAGT